MSAFFGGVNTLLPWCKVKEVNTDNIVFRLHYNVTVFILFSFVIAITTTQLFSEPMRCIGNTEKAKDSVLNNYCFIVGTHTVKNDLKGKVGKDVAYPGVGSKIGDEIHHSYYQWVYFLLPIQAVSFYIPHILWKYFEGHKIKGITEKLNTAVVPEEWTMEKRIKLAKYLININLHTHNMFGYQFAFCELLNFLNTIMQIYVLDVFLNYQFWQYGIDFLKYHSGYWEGALAHPMDIVFPKLSRCYYRTYGASGDVQKFDLLCVLSLNAINEKIFLFLWFWLLILSFISALALLYRILVFIFPCIRAYSIIVQAKLVPKYYIFSIVSHFSFSDWFMLNQIGKNMNIFVFKELVMIIGEELEKIRKVEYV